MIGNLKNLKKDLSKYHMVKVKIEEMNENLLHYSYTFIGVHSHVFDIFLVNFNRIILIYSVILDSMQNNDNFKYHTFSQTAIILAITSFEIYLIDIFLHLSKLNLIGNIKYRDFKKFINQYGIKINPTKENYNGLKKVRLFYLLPKRLRFQNKDYLKVAFRLIDVDICEIDKKLWDKIIASPKDSYMQKRHDTVHGRSDRLSLNFERIDIETVENCILDIAKFIYLIDNHIVDKYPKVQYYSSFYQKSN